MRPGYALWRYAHRRRPAQSRNINLLVLCSGNSRPDTCHASHHPTPPQPRPDRSRPPQRRPLPRPGHRRRQGPQLPQRAQARPRRPAALRAGGRSPLRAGGADHPPDGRVEPESEIEARLVKRMAIAFWKSERAERIEVALFDAAPKLRPPQAGFEWEEADPLTTFDLKRFNAVRGYQAQQGRELSPLPQGAAPAAPRAARGMHGRTRHDLTERTHEPVHARQRRRPSNRLLRAMPAIKATAERTRRARRRRNPSQAPPAPSSRANPSGRRR